MAHIIKRLASLGYYLRVFALSPSFRFSLPVFFPWSRRCRFSMVHAPGWSRGALPGLEALCLASRRFVWYCDALCSLWYVVCRCDSGLVCPGESLSVSSQVSAVPPPLRLKHIRGTTVSSVIDAAPRGEEGMAASAEEAECSVICQLHQLRPP